jgi:hypothetical protein
MGVDVVPPSGDLAMQVGNAVDDRHQISSLTQQGSTGPLVKHRSIVTAWTGQTCGGGLAY